MEKERHEKFRKGFMEDCEASYISLDTSVPHKISFSSELVSAEGSDIVSRNLQGRTIYGEVMDLSDAGVPLNVENSDFNMNIYARQYSMRTGSSDVEHLIPKKNRFPFYEKRVTQEKFYEEEEKFYDWEVEILPVIDNESMRILNTIIEKQDEEDRDDFVEELLSNYPCIQFGNEEYIVGAYTQDTEVRISEEGAQEVQIYLDENYDLHEEINDVSQVCTEVLGGVPYTTYFTNIKASKLFTFVPDEDDDRFEITLGIRVVNCDRSEMEEAFHEKLVQGTLDEEFVDTYIYPFFEIREFKNA